MGGFNKGVMIGMLEPTQLVGIINEAIKLYEKSE